MAATVLGVAEGRDWMPLVNFRIAAEDRLRLKAVCEARGLTLSEGLREAAGVYVATRGFELLDLEPVEP